MDETRPDPDLLLARARAEEEARTRGRLKVFLGAAPGVGKTYAMLEAAQARLRESSDVVIGLVETHGRAETERLAAGLERLPLRLIEYRGLTLREFDLDAAIHRHPKLVLVDELAHTNAAGSRHAKRWQDVAEILDAGIDVYTTLNVQHVESLNDLVLQITGVRVRETVPDSVLESAHEVELIDLPPDELLQRLKEGKVYFAEQAERAREHFFQKGNLLALRELALRVTAQRVDAQMETYRREFGIVSPWPAGERLLVCVGPAPQAAGLIRAGRRMAAALRAPWYVVVVETPGMRTMPASDRTQLERHMRLAEELGAETVRLSGERVSEEILAFARRKNVARILVGKPTHARWRDRLKGSLLDGIVRGGAGIEVHVIDATDAAPPAPVPTVRRGTSIRSYVAAAGIVGTITAIGLVARGKFDQADLAMLYVLGIVVVALRTSLRPSVMASFLSILAYDFCFVPPFYTFAVDDLRHLLSFAVMLLVGLVISTLVSRVREEVETTRDRARRTAELYALSRELAAATSREEICAHMERRTRELFGRELAILLPDTSGALKPSGTAPPDFLDSPKERSVAQWAYDLQRAAGKGTETLRAAEALYLPMRGTRGVAAVLAVRRTDQDLEDEPDLPNLLAPFAHLGALALERADAEGEAQRAQVEVEAERLHSSLLSSVSHDLRTPLAVITSAAGRLLTRGAKDPDEPRELAATIHAEASRLTRLIENLLDMTRLETGRIQLRLQWASVEEIVGTALHRMEAELKGREVRTDVPQDLPLVAVDPMLIETLLVNLLENAVRYTPEGSAIEVSAKPRGDAIAVSIADSGPGLAPGDLSRIFEKFYRGRRDERGFGLGLAICKGIADVHGGEMEAENGAAGGAIFRVVLPIGRPDQG